MIKSINYQANQIASIEISDAEDVQSLGDSWGYGSTARVTGKIESEYMYTPQGWIKTAGGSSGGDGGVLVVHDIDGTLDKTWKEIHDAPLAVLKADDGAVKSVSFYNVYDGEFFVQFQDSESEYYAEDENDYPTAPDPDAGGDGGGDGK